MPKKEYVEYLFRLSRKDFEDIGCTNKELDEIDKLNQELDGFTKREKESEEGLSKEDSQKKRLLEETLYVKFLEAADRNPRKWEYADSVLPSWAVSTGNISTQEALLRSYGESLPLADKVRLLKRRMATMKANRLAKEEREKYRENPHTVVEDENGVFLEGVHQDRFQSNINSCWSASMELLLKSRGVTNVTQTDIRAFRPDYKAEEIRRTLLNEAPSEDDINKGITGRKMSEINAEVFRLMQTASGNNIMERGDAFLKLAPGSMLQGIQISGYDEEARRAGLSRSQYLANAENVVKEHIIHAIKEEKSPVSFLRGGHYITITGIDKDGYVQYKDSADFSGGKGPDATRKIKLNTLLKRLIAKNPGSVNMEWAADIKLSQDGKTLYGMPSSHLQVGEDGKLIRPDALNGASNLAPGYQQKSGTYVMRRNFSEDPNEDKTRDEYLQNGGVNLSQRAYLPEQLDMETLKKKAQSRTPEEEKHLQDMSGDFYKVEYKKDSPTETTASMNAKYNSETAAFINRKREDVASVVESAKFASQRNEGPEIGGEYAEYIGTFYKKTDLAALKEYQLKNNVCIGIAAAKLEAEGVPFDEAKIKKTATQIKNNPAIDNMGKEDLLTILNQDKRVAAFAGAYKEIENGSFKVEPKYQDGYFREMKELADNMMPKAGRTTAYQRVYDAVQAAANLDRKDPDLNNKIAVANKEILESVEAYTKGKKRVRASDDGKARFDNSMDALSIVGIFAPKGCKARSEKLIARVNEVRGLKKGMKLRIMDFGGENAREANMERMQAAKGGPKK